jgi:alkylation response protein AidB-like acyl-CoA dehydrogenase
MDLALDSTQTLLRDAVRGYLEAEVPFDRIRALERDGRSDEALWQVLCAQGWLGVALPERWGGAGATLIEAGILVEELARRAAVVPAAEVLACLLALARTQASQAAEALARDALAGSAVVVPALLERDANPEQVELSVAERGLHGEKHFVDYGQFTTHHMVSARDARAGGEPALFLVRCDARTSSRALRTLGRTPQALVRYAGSAAARIADLGALRELVLLARSFAAVQCLGAAQQALDASVRYATLRVQFGRPIGSFQAVKHHAANMAMRVESSRFLVYETLDALERGVATPRQVALAKASASRCVSEVTQLAHQIHGGNGVIEENDLYFFTLRGKDRALAWGSFEECLVEASVGLEGPRDWVRGPRRLDAESVS